jgi:raffinose/stachyose/melibiose transport system permease protein
MFLFSNVRNKLLLILPTLFFFTLYTFYPLVDSVKKSFYHRPRVHVFDFVGLDNYRSLFADIVFQKALLNTFIIMAGQLILLIPFSLLLGLFINYSFRGNAIVKLISFAPNIISGIMVGLLWSFILDPKLGLFNGFLSSIGLDHLATTKWIGGEHLTPYSVAFVNSWKNVGGFAVLYLAGMKMLPSEIFEAAKIDGASNMQRFYHLTIPLLKETTKICTVITIVKAVNEFEIVYMLTGGGPYDFSQTLPTYMYKIMFGAARSDIGYGSAIATVMFVIIMVLTILYLNITRKRIDE